MTAMRRLAAVLAADVAGFSRLMGADEEGTLEQLNAHRRQLVDPKIKEHHGRIVKTTGDGVLVEFSSVVDAVRCAAEIQRGMVDRGAELSEARRIRLRVGINLGDIIVEGDDIFGDGVNVAARLEALAEPGGICISRVVRDQIRDKLPFNFADLGEQSVKNIARPVRVYALTAEATSALPKSAEPAAPPSSSILVGPRSHSSAGPRLSIVVLPFNNLSNDPEQDYFADGITEDLTTDLSRIEGTLVIARNTAFTYKGRAVDARQVGRELGVRYVLEGSVRRLGRQVRVNGQLIDAESNGHLWAERFDGDVGDLFGLQNEITARIAGTVRSELVVAEAGRSTEDPDAQDYVLRGRAMQMRPITRERYVEAVKLFERALTIDPSSVSAQSWLASALVGRALNLLSDLPGADIQSANDLIAAVLAITPHSAFAHWVKGQILRAQSRCEEAIFEYQAAIALDRNFNNAYGYLGGCKLLTGSLDEVIPLEEQAIRLSPHDPNRGNWYFFIGAVYLLQSKFDEAIVWLERARGAFRPWHVIEAALAAAYALRGDAEHASAALAEARKLSKLSDLYSSIARLKAYARDWDISCPAGRPHFELPRLRAFAEPTYFAGLRKAGMPEE
jgi:adenylate cyclase